MASDVSHYFIPVVKIQISYERITTNKTAVQKSTMELEFFFLLLLGINESTFRVPQAFLSTLPPSTQNSSPVHAVSLRLSTCLVEPVYEASLEIARVPTCYR